MREAVGGILDIGIVMAAKGAAGVYHYGEKFILDLAAIRGDRVCAHTRCSAGSIIHHDVFWREVLGEVHDFLEGNPADICRMRV